jgi:hypothetical protein
VSARAALTPRLSGETPAPLSSRYAPIDARYMAGGHYAWKALKAPVKVFEPTPT